MSDLVGNPEDRFSRVAAQFVSDLFKNHIVGFLMKCLIFFVFQLL